jgi:hypothetical protein
MPEPAAADPQPGTTAPPMPSEVTGTRRLRPAASSLRKAMMPLRNMMRRTPRRP